MTRDGRFSAVAFAVLAIAARLPFLLSGRLAFDSDEAVEGLMARHLLGGEFPAFFWGQAFKGVPEVYTAAGAFATFGPGVGVLKGVTLAFFGAYVGLNFSLIDKLAGRWVAAASSLFLIVGPPALVFWSLDASAEYVLMMLVGTAFLLLSLKYQKEPSPRLLTVLGVVTGLGLWIHQLFAFYLVPVAVILTVQSGLWEEPSVRRIGPAAKTLGALALIYLALAAVAFLTGGFSIDLAWGTVGARAPQKMLRIGAAVAVIAFVVHLLTGTRRETAFGWIRHHLPFAAGFCVGYLPVILYSVLIAPARSPARVANLRDLVRATPDLLGNVVPILSGFKIATTERLPIPLMAAVPVVAALIAYLWSHRRRLLGFVTLRPHDASIAADFFPLFIVTAPLLFIVSGAYLDTQSYRYLIPCYAGLSVALASGSLVLAGRQKTIAGVVMGTILAVSAAQQILWYQRIAPDTESGRIIECLRQHGVRGGYADYWLSYKLTFLSNEEIIVAPGNGVDRYPPYTEFVRSLPPEARANSVEALCTAGSPVP